jgi:hypothetical protein
MCPLISPLSAAPISSGGAERASKPLQRWKIRGGPYKSSAGSHRFSSVTDTFYAETEA